MTHRSRSSKHVPSGQKMRGSQSSKPRHVPDGTPFSYGTCHPLGQESPFPERNYILSATHPEYSQGHAREVPWNFTGYENPPDGDVSLAYPGSHGEFQSNYAACIEENDQYQPGYSSSTESPALRSHNLPWTASNVDASIYSSLDSDFDMLNGHAILQSSSGLYVPLSAEVDLLPAHEPADAMYSAPVFLPNGPYCQGNLPEGMQAMPNGIYAYQRTAVESSPQSWTTSQQFPGMQARMPLTPPASDHGSPPGPQECSSLSGQDAYEQHSGLPPQERAPTHHFAEYSDESYSHDVTRWNQIQSTATKKPVLAQRPIRSASDRRGSHESEDSHTFQPEGNHSADAQPRSHPFYQNSKGEDGKWHCPFKEETNCNHEPTLQKCGFDKYLDSHLKPFVCTHHDCGSPRFSSNACLFRHQREAHGLHGHGENPHLCRFPGCERAQERNGFPRKWNLKDHMKRVHGWEDSDDTPSSDSQPGPSHKSGQPVRKRKGTPPVASVPMKRQSSSQTKARAASITYFQHNHPHQYAVDQGYPMTWKQPQSEAPSFRGVFPDAPARINGYTPPVGHSQISYRHGSQYSC